MKLSKFEKIAVLIIIFEIILLVVAAEATTNTASTTAVPLIEEMEGFRSSPYQIGGSWTIGFGTEISDPKQWGTITRAEARSLAVRHIETQSLPFLRKKVEGFEKLPAKVQVALISAHYNAPGLIGPNLTGFLEKGDWDSASKELAWDHNPKGFYGLVVRRVKEANLIREAFGLPALTTPKSIKDFEVVKANWKATRKL